MTDPKNPYDWPGFIPQFHVPLDQRIKQEVPCMSTKPESKPPEGTPTPSTVSLPSFTEWLGFFESKRHLLDEGAWGPEVMANLTQDFLAQRGSPP